MNARQDRPRNGTDEMILEIRDLSVTFEMDRGTSRVVDGVDLDVYRHETLGVVGESGSGKSMLASAILDAVVEPGQTAGEITFYPQDGEPIDVLNLDREELDRYRWEDVSMVFQGAMSSFNPTLKIHGHFAETIDRHGMDMDDGMARARQLLTDLYLDPDRVLDSYAHELSGGMRQRTLLALCLVLDPELVVMDEPTAALDLLMQRSILTLLRNLQETYDLTILFITHDLPLVAKLADRLAVLYAFELIELGPTDEIVLDAAHPYTRALLKATPNLEAPTDEMHSIDGMSPDPVAVPSGCSYHPRCPLSDDRCVEDDPDLLAVDDEHRSACFYYERAAQAVPFSAEMSSWGESQ